MSRYRLYSFCEFIDRYIRRVEPPEAVISGTMDRRERDRLTGDAPPNAQSQLGKSVLRASLRV
jgi:hypothetical protein